MKYKCTCIHVHNESATSSEIGRNEWLVLMQFPT